MFVSFTRNHNASIEDIYRIYCKWIFFVFATKAAFSVYSHKKSAEHHLFKDGSPEKDAPLKQKRGLISGKQRRERVERLPRGTSLN